MTADEPLAGPGVSVSIGFVTLSPHRARDSAMHGRGYAPRRPRLTFELDAWMAISATCGPSRSCDRPPRHADGVRGLERSDEDGWRRAGQRNGGEPVIPSRHRPPDHHHRAPAGT